MTRAMYYDDPMARIFDATIERIEDEGRTIILAETLFYPEGGGQPADHGTINGICVNDVQKDSDGTIRHILDQPLGITLRPDRPAIVQATIDWDRRWDYMQQHTGQHVLSGALSRTAGAGTVSVHQGADLTTIEVDATSLDDATLAAVEDDANRAIRDDLPVRGFWVGDEELANYSLRRPTSRTGAIRLVEIADYDLVACGGVHLPRSGMLNVVHLSSVERIRGHLRLAFTIGDRAITDYRARDAIVRKAATQFSTHAFELNPRISAAIGEIQTLHGELRRRTEQVAVRILAAHSGPTLILDEADAPLFGALAQGAADSEVTPLCILHQTPEGLHWAIIFGPTDFPQEQIRTKLLTPFGAKGGGKPPLWRGIIKEPEYDTAARFAARFEEIVGVG